MPKTAPIWLNSLAGLAALGAGLAASGAAQAQFFFDTWGGTFRERWEDDDLPGYRDALPLDRADIRAILARRGYRLDAPMARDNDVFIVQAIDPAGRRLRLIVDAFDGRILRRYEANLSAPPPPPQRGRNFEDDYFDAPARPPRDVPAERFARPEVEPEVIPGVGPSPRTRPEPPPRKPATARAEPKPAAPKPPVAQKPAEPAKPVETARPEPAPKAEEPKEAARPSPPAKPQQAEAAPPKPEEKTQAAGPRVIPLYKKPDEAPAGTAAEGQK